MWDAVDSCPVDKASGSDGYKIKDYLAFKLGCMEMDG